MNRVYITVISCITIVYSYSLLQNEKRDRLRRIQDNGKSLYEMSYTRGHTKHNIDDLK